MTDLAEIPEQPDRVPGDAIGWALGATVVTIAVCALVVWLLIGGLTGGGRSDVVRLSLVPPAEPFSETSRTEAARAERELVADRWRWADAAHTKVAMPASAAIERYLARQGAR